MVTTTVNGVQDSDVQRLDNEHASHAITDRIRDYLACIASEVERELLSDTSNNVSVLSRFRAADERQDIREIRELCVRHEEALFQRIVRRSVLLSREVNAMESKLIVDEDHRNGFSWRVDSSGKSARHFAKNIEYLLGEIRREARELCDKCETAYFFY